MHMINWYHRNPKVFYFPLLENMSFDQTVTVTVADECQKMFNEKCPLLTILHFVYFNKKLLSLGFICLALGIKTLKYKWGGKY